jgi:hypothetical protein
MNKLQVSALVASALTLTFAACGKKSEQPATADNATPPPVESPASSPAAVPSQSDAERAEKLALLDYATMEDNYINDAHAQWASTATASSTFGDDNGEPAQSNLASNVTGTVDSKTWTNNKQDVGMDWLETHVARAVAATEVRVVFQGGRGVEAVSKLELQDPQGNWNTVWSGLSDVKADNRGSRTWFVRKFEKTAYAVNAVKITIANNVQRGYKVVDAVQLIGD